MRSSSFFRDIPCCVGGMFSRMARSVIRLGDREIVPEAEFIIHPRISFETLQSPSPALTFFRLIESLSSPSTVG